MKKPAGAKPKPKVTPWAPVPVAVQRRQHRIAVRKWKPVPVSVQRKQHRIAVKAGTPKPGRKGKVRKLALGDAVACCAAQAVGTLLGLSDDEVLELYGLTADGPEDGATIEETLIASGYLETGDAPERPAGQLLALIPDPIAEALAPGDQHGWPGVGDEAAVHQHLVRHTDVPGDLVDVEFHGLILGLELPAGPHAVLATEAGWWSWGELYDPGDFPGAVVEEAWAVTWRP